MKQKSGPVKQPAEGVVWDLWRATRGVALTVSRSHAPKLLRPAVSSFVLHDRHGKANLASRVQVQENGYLVFGGNRPFSATSEIAPMFASAFAFDGRGFEGRAACEYKRVTTSSHRAAR